MKPRGDNFWNVPNPCYPCLVNKSLYVNSTEKVINGVKMVLTLCPDCARQMKGLDGENQSTNIYEPIPAGQVVELQLFPKPPE